jgi:hypothetical protein
MKIRLGVIILAGVLLGACSSGSSFSSRKRVTQGIDYSRYGKQESYYEFSSPVPSDLGENAFADTLTSSQTPADSEEILGEDEDFVSENLAGSYRSYGDVVVTVASRKFELGSSATRKDMSMLMKAIETSYTKSFRMYQPTGFTYTMSSVGAVNPLSVVQIQCRMSERSANANGQKACQVFFEQIKVNFLRLKANTANEGK